MNRWAIKDRFKSKTAWAALAGCIAIIFTAFGIWEKIGITSDMFQAIVTSIGSVLTAFGIFNDPTNREGF